MSTTSNSSLERGGKKGKKAKSKAEQPGSGITSPPEKAKGGKVTPLAPHSGTNQVVPPTDGGEKAIGKPTSGKLFSPGDDQASVEGGSEFLKNRDLRDTSDSEDDGDPTDPILQPEPYRGREKPDPPRDAERIDPNDSEVRRSREADDADWEEYFEEKKRERYEKGLATKKRNRLREEEERREKEELRKALKEKDRLLQEAGYRERKTTQEMELMRERLTAMGNARAHDLSRTGTPSPLPSSNMELGVPRSGEQSNDYNPLLSHQPKLVMKPTQPVNIVNEFSWPKFLKLKEQLQLTRANGNIVHRDDFILGEVMDKIRDCYVIFRERRDLSATEWDEFKLHELTDEEFFDRLEQSMQQNQVRVVTRKKFDEVIHQADPQLLADYSGLSQIPVRRFIDSIDAEMKSRQVEEPSEELVQRMATVLFDMIDIDPTQSSVRHGRRELARRLRERWSPVKYKMTWTNLKRFVIITAGKLVDELAVADRCNLDITVEGKEIGERDLERRRNLGKPRTSSDTRAYSPRFSPSRESSFSPPNYKSRSDDPDTGGNFSGSKRQGDNRHPSTTRDQKRPRVSSSPSVECTICGWNHKGECYLRNHPDANHNPKVRWRDSEKGRDWFAKDGSTRLPREKTLSGESHAPTGHNPAMLQRWQRKKGEWLLALDFMSNDKLPVLPCTVGVGDRSKELSTEAFLDTGSTGRNYIDWSLAEDLRAQGAILHTCDAVVCSPVKRTCDSCKGKVTFNVTFSYNEKRFRLRDFTAYVVDLPWGVIVGYPTVRKHDLTNQFRELFTASQVQHLECLPDKPSVTAEHGNPSKEGEQPSSSEDGRVRPKAITSLGEWLSILSESAQHSEFVTSEEEAEVNEMLPDVTEYLPSSGRGGGEHDEGSLLPAVIGDLPSKDKIKDLLKRYSSCFSREVKREPAKLHSLTLEVDTSLWEVRGNRAQPRPQSVEKTLEIVKQVNRMLELDIIERSDATEWSQVLLVPKPGGAWRFCVDFRNLNSSLVKKGWPIPNIKRMLHRVGQKHPGYFGIMDATSGFFQCMLHPESRKYSAFITDVGIFQWKRVPMGIATAPSYFQRAIAGTVMAGLMYECMEMYIDDMLVYGRTEEEFLVNLEKVLERLKEFNITVNPDKCKLGLTEVEFVGHVLNKDGSFMSEKKRGKIVNFPIPTDVKQLRSFLGMANYFREHIRNHSIEVQPLYELLRGKGKRGPVSWTTEGEKAFEKIKDLIANCPTLFFVDVEYGGLYLETDASDYGIGAYLYQKDREGKHRPIAFMSKALNPTERRWSTVEKEQYAIFRAFKEFEHLIRGFPLIVRTDHKNLVSIKDTHGKIARWRIAIDTFQYKIEYVEGKENAVADNLSRCMEDIQPEQSSENLLMDFSDVQEITEEQMRSRLSACHNPVVGHRGVDATIEYYKKYYGPYPRLREYVTAFIRACPFCQKISDMKEVIHTAPFVLSGHAPMRKISIDTVGPLNKEPDGYEYILVIIDNFTRFVELYPTKSVGAEEAAECLFNFFGRYGKPELVIHDKGTQFQNELVIKLIELMQATPVPTLTGSKEQNAIVERANKEVMRHLRALVFCDGLKFKWAKRLPLVQRIMNATRHSSIGAKPAQLLFGDAVDLDRGLFLESVEKVTEKNAKVTSRSWLDQLVATQRDLIQASDEFQKTLDQKHLEERKPKEVTTFSPGDHVLVAYGSTLTGRKPPTKLDTKWRGPLKVIKQVGNEITLEDLVTKKEEKHHIATVQPFDSQGMNETELQGIAAKDRNEFVVKEIIGHEGYDPSGKYKKSDVKFHVKWVNLPNTTWEEYSKLRDVDKLHEYLEARKMVDLIPLKFRKHQRRVKKRLAETPSSDQNDQRARKHRKLVR